MRIELNKRLMRKAGQFIPEVNRTSGEKECKIELATHYLNKATRIRDILLHELIHAANWMIDENQDDDDHG